jgi:transposase
MSHTKKGDRTMQVSRIGFDIAKQSFQVHGVDAHGKVVVRKQLSRSKVLPYFAQLPACLVGLEACGGAHYWARELCKLGHDVRLMAVAMIQPYRTGPKNDQNDAEAICEAVSRPRTRFVPVKTEAQQAVLQFSAKRSDQKSRWVEQVRRRRGNNIAAVALAAKHARILWALLARGQEYRLAA